MLMTTLDTSGQAGVGAEAGVVGVVAGTASDRGRMMQDRVQQEQQQQQVAVEVVSTKADNMLDVLKQAASRSTEADDAQCQPVVVYSSSMV